MPYIPKTNRKSWQPKTKPHQSRERRPFYSSRQWRKVRAAKLQQDPLCEECLRNEVETAAQMVDHIKRINPANPFDNMEGKWGDPFNFDNLQSLCNRCHAKKSGKESHGR